MKRVRVTRDAGADLDEIWLYVARDSEDVATQLIDEITARFTLLAQAPRIGRQRDDLMPGVRTHVVGNYVIYCREAQRNVSILRVLHGARNRRRVFASRS